MTSRLMSM